MMKEKVKEHILFTMEMLAPVGLSTLIFGVIALIVGKSLVAVSLILFSWLIYEMNWKFDDLKDEIKKLKKKK